MSERLFKQGDIIMFVGWLSGQIPELHGVETPRLLQAVYDWMELPANQCGPSDQVGSSDG